MIRTRGKTMSKFGKGAVASAAVAAGLLGALAGVSFAAVPLSEATATSQGAAATALGVPDVLTVSESTADDDAATWSALSVAGTSVVGRDSSGDWAGPAAGGGGLLDSLNALTCSTDGGPLATSGLVTCIKLLNSDAFSYFGNFSGGSIVDVAAVYYDADGDDTHGRLMVLPSEAAASECRKQSGAAILAGHVVTGSSETPLELGLAEDRYTNCAS